MNLGKQLLNSGPDTAIIGALIWGFGRLGIRRLPGDIYYQSDGVRHLYPIVTLPGAINSADGGHLGLAVAGPTLIRLGELIAARSAPEAEKAAHRRLLPFHLGEFLLSSSTFKCLPVDCLSRCNNSPAIRSSSSRCSVSRDRAFW